MRWPRFLLFGILVGVVLPTAAATVGSPIGIGPDFSRAIELVADKGTNPNENCLKNTECKAALEAYLDAKTKHTSAETSYSSAAAKLYQDVMRDPNFLRAVSDIKNRLKVLIDLSDHIEKLISGTNAVNKFVTAADAAITASKDGVGKDNRELIFATDRSSRLLSLDPKTLLGDEKAKLLSLLDLVRSYRDEEPKHVPALPLADLKSFKDKAITANLDQYANGLAQATTAVEAARGKACALGAVIYPPCEAATAAPPPGQGPLIQIVRADYGDLRAGRIELAGDAIKQVRRHTCDAAGYFRLKCELAPYRDVFCTKRTPATGDGAKIEVGACPKSPLTEAEIKLGWTENITLGVGRIARVDPMCVVDVSFKDICGGFNPAPNSERAVLVQYKCRGGAEGSVGKIVGRDGEKVYLECPVRQASR